MADKDRADDVLSDGPSRATSFQWLWKNALDGFGKGTNGETLLADEKPPALAGPQKRPAPSSIELDKWLDEALALERTRIARVLREQHRQLLEDFREHAAAQGGGAGEAPSRGLAVTARSSNGHTMRNRTSLPTLKHNGAATATAAIADHSLEVCAAEGKKLVTLDDKVEIAHPVEVAVPVSPTEPIEAMDSDEPADEEVPMPRGDVNSMASEKMSEMRRRISNEAAEMAMGIIVKNGNWWEALGLEKVSRDFNAGSLVKAAEDLVKSQTFEVFFVIVILLNALLMAVQLQMVGQNYGAELQIHGYSRTADEAYPNWEDGIIVVERIFTTAFVTELAIRLIAYRCSWFRSFWNYLDAFIVSMGVLAWAKPELLAVDPTVVRLIRFSKLMRLVRVLRSQNILESLHLLMVCLKSSAHTLFWSVCILVMIQAIAAMLLSQLVEPFLQDESQPLEIKQQVFRYYGSFWRAVITMFEITFANWAPPCRLLLDHVGEAFGAFFILYRCVIGFAVLSVIQAVFIHSTLKSAQQDTEFMLQQRRREQSKLVKRLSGLFESLDASGDGTVSWQEFAPFLADPNMKLLLSTLELEPRDLNMVFSLLDDGDGLLTREEFISGVQSLKGGAKALDVMSALHILKRLEMKVDAIPGQGPDIDKMIRRASLKNAMSQRAYLIEEPDL